MRVGFVGLGNMGLAMAGCLLDAGHELIVWNRTAAKAEPLAERGARVAASLADVAEADVVITMLTNDAAVREVVFGGDGLLARLGPGNIHIGMSTIGVALAEELTQAHAALGQTYVGAPVFGRPEAAAAKKLFIVAAGAAEARARVRPLFDAMGQRVFDVGERAALSHLYKVCGNFMLLSAIEAMGEAFALVESSGGAPGDFYEMFSESIFGALVYKNYGKMIVEKRFDGTGGFTLAGGLKDAQLALAAADAVHAPLPLASLVRDHLQAALARGDGGLDLPAIGKLARERAGLT